MGRMSNLYFYNYNTVLLTSVRYPSQIVCIHTFYPLPDEVGAVSIGVAFDSRPCGPPSVCLRFVSRADLGKPWGISFILQAHIP